MNKVSISKWAALLMLVTLWLFAPASFATPVLSCDVNFDQIVDKTDISLITAAVGQSATGPGDARDVDHDGKITSIDARTCVNQCTLPKCATPVATPGVAGLTQAAAQTALTSAGLTLGAVTQQSSSTVQAGKVISQSPLAGASVAVGSAVALVVSSGPAPVVAPNVVGLTQAAAQTALTSAGLTLGAVTQQSSSTVQAGKVISQSPLAGASVAVGSAVALVVSSGPAPVVAPNVVGLTQAAAQTALTSAGLTLGAVTQQSSSTVQAGNVISQSPLAGASVAVGSAVALVVSSGPAPVVAPNVVGLTQAAAQTALTSAGLTLGSVTQQSSSTVQAGNVISQSPLAGASVAVGSAVALVVSSGPAPVVAPNVVGLTQAAAQTALTSAGLTLGAVTQQNSSTVLAGKVISQSPLAGASVAVGSAVALVISSGPAPVVVPNVVGLTQAAAQTALTSAGLTLGSVTQQSSSTVQAGNVISQSPLAGASVAVGSAVALVVSSGPAPVVAPNVVGLTQAAAQTALTSAGLTLGSVTQQSSSTVQAGNVISQSPLAGASVAVGSAVALVVSSGPAPVVAPNVVGLTQAAAQTALTSAGLTLGAVTQQSSSTVQAGKVISQSPLAGASVAVGSSVNLVISSGTGAAAPSSINLTPSQFIIGAGGSITVAAEVLDSSGNVIAPTPSIDYQIQFAAAAVTGTTPTVNGNQINTSSDTRGSFTVEAAVASTSVTKTFVFTVIQNNSQSKNSGNLVILAAAQTSVVRNLAAISAAMQSGNTANISAASASLTAAGATLNVNGLALGTVYEPDTGFVPSTAQLAGRHSATASDANFSAITSQLRTKLQQIKQLLNQPSGNEANDNALLAQYATDLQALWDQSQLVQNRASVYGLVNSADAANSMLVQDVPAVLLAVISRVNSQLQSSGVLALQGNAQNMYALVGQGTQLPTAMYTSSRPVFLLTGLLGYAGNIGGLIQKIYGDYLDQVQKMYLLLAVEGLLNQFLDQFVTVGGLITGASQSFQAYHIPDSVIYVGGISAADAASADVFLIGGAAINRVSGLITTLRSAGSIRSIKDLYNFYNSMLDELKGAGEDYNTAHQQPNSVVASSFDNGGCLLSSVDPCDELTYDSGFNYVGSGGPISLEPVIILVKTNSSRGSEFGSGIFNFVGR